MPARSAWLSYKCQLWGGLKYRLGASLAKLEELKNGLGTRDHKILSMLGMCRSINTQWRNLPHCYGGMELCSLPIKTTAASINSFLQHYGTKTNLGLYLTALIENLQHELGVSRCQFEYGYDTRNGLATDSWVKLLWEQIWNYNIQLEVDYKPLTMPREYDKCIMERFVNERVRGHELVAINRVRKHQQAMFVSDIAAANGKSIEAIYLASWEDSYERELGRRCSHFDFGTDHPSKTD